MSRPLTLDRARRYRRRCQGALVFIALLTVWNVAWLASGTSGVATFIFTTSLVVCGIAGLAFVHLIKAWKELEERL